MTYCSDNGLSRPYCARKASTRSLPNWGAAFPAISFNGSPGIIRGRKKLIEMAKRNVMPNSMARREKLFIMLLFHNLKPSSDHKQLDAVRPNAYVDRSPRQTDEVPRGWRSRQAKVY